MSLTKPVSYSNITDGHALNVLAFGRNDFEGFQVIREAHLDTFRFTFISDVSGAIKQLDENGGFDAVLVDLTPETENDVIDVVRAVRKTDNLDAAPIIALIPPDGFALVARFIETGGTDFLTTPITAHALSIRLEMARRHVTESNRLQERTQQLARKIAQRDDELDDLRRFAQDIVSGINSILLVLDENLTILFANNAFRSLQNMDPTEIIGCSLNQLLSASALEGGVSETIARVAITGEPIDIPRVNGLFYGKENNVYHIQASSIVYGDTRQILFLGEDVTRRALVEQQVMSERSKLQEVIDALGASLILVDTNANMLWSNKVFEDLYGETGDPSQRMAFWNRIHNCPTPLGAIVASGRPYTDNWIYIGGDGIAHHYKNVIVPLGERTDPSGSRELVILTQDLTREEVHGQQLNLLRELWEVMGSIMDLESLFHVIMVCATAGHALGFNRAFLFIRDPERNELVGHMAIGPASREEAFRIWSSLSAQSLSLSELLRKAEQNVPTPDQQPLYPLIAGTRYPLNNVSEIIVRAAIEKKPIVVRDASSDPRVPKIFLDKFQTSEFIVVPLISKGAIMGVTLADNFYSGRAVTEEHMQLLSIFAGLSGMAIENAMTFDELRNTLKTLKETQDKLLHSEKLATVGRMAAHIAHEIRNPLSAIGGFAKSIIKKPDDVSRVVKSAGIISEESDRLENILRTVMDFTRPSSPRPVVCNINVIIEQCLVRAKSQFRKNRIKLIRDMDPALPDAMYDKDQLQQVFINLILNAVQAMSREPEGKPRFLTLKTERLESTIHIHIQDTGCGIPEKNIDNLFNPFYTTKPDGTGLGLAVVQQIIVEHNGIIEIHSQEGVGTTFSIRLPVTDVS